jgi:mRNA interferase RelE/StbE
MFSLEFSHQAQKFIKKCDSALSRRIIDKIKKLEIDPVPHDAKRIIGEEKTFRIRVGDYRILYEIGWDSNKILIAVIDNRSKVYD